MNNDNPNPNPTPSDASQPTATPPADQAPPSQDKGTPDAIEMAKKLGELETENKILKAYQEKVDPVLATIQSDQTIYNNVLQAHNKRLGVTPADEPADDGTTPAIPAGPSRTELDNRNAHIQNIVKEFYSETGIDKLEEDGKKQINGAIMSKLRNMLDPMGNKTDIQIFQDVSLTKLPEFLRDAHFLSTKDDQLKAAEEKGRNAYQQEATGVLGSFSSTSVEPDNITLSVKEKDTIAKAGWDEAKYLENKKKLLTATPNT